MMIAAWLSAYIELLSTETITGQNNSPQRHRDAEMIQKGSEQ
jgi:hypothetical protein